MSGMMVEPIWNNRCIMHLQHIRIFSEWSSLSDMKINSYDNIVTELCDLHNYYVEYRKKDIIYFQNIFSTSLEVFKFWR